MDYERRLLLAANLVLSSDRSYEPPPEPYELGITAVLKPHQIEGLSWLIRRYHLGVNVVLGDEELPFDVLLTTYDITLLDQDFLSQIPWDYAVIDEAQRLKNPSSVLYNVLEHNFVMPRRLLLTGTPIQNNLSELWALMHFCMPSIFGTSDQFISTFKEAGSSSAGNPLRQKFHCACIELPCVIARFVPLSHESAR
ncbi:hypothetical protein ZIOFF_062876 [Zingiber officinale]|uniref:Helicase ATP-binding domain-containing protein n=1 Tax=Zingiber officinale TaxID=94328 RepID=A0A8J5KJN2_ZINOF|nr:hypothetical protein ZIOFF_062876 [Zingiber officinale]